MERFTDRRDAGRVLAKEIIGLHRSDRCDRISSAAWWCSCGYEVALALNAPLDIFLVRKLGLPGREELAIGAIASGAYGY